MTSKHDSLINKSSFWDEEILGLSQRGPNKTKKRRPDSIHRQEEVVPNFRELRSSGYLTFLTGSNHHPDTSALAFCTADADSPPDDPPLNPEVLQRHFLICPGPGTPTRLCQEVP